MGYFNIPTYRDIAPTTNAVKLPDPISFTLPQIAGVPIAGTDGSTQILSGAPNSASRAYYATLLSGLPGQAATRMGTARNNARDALRGYGGVTFRNDDTSTANVDESLMVDYRPDQVGRNERQAVIRARAAAAARGVMYSSQGNEMVGTALQRVGEEARAIVNQYAAQINGIATETNMQAQGYIGQIASLYGQDATWDADRISKQQAAVAPAPAPPPWNAGNPSPDAQSNETLAWTGSAPPNLRTLMDRFPGKQLRTVTISNYNNTGKARYVVYAY